MIQKNIELIVENITELIISCQADKFVINGGLKSGKSHTLNMLQKELTKEPYSVLYLGENINTSFYMEYGVFSIPLSNTNYKGKKLKEGIRSSIALFCESSSALTQFLSSLDTLSIEHSLFNLNSTEIEIIKRIYSFSTEEYLIILADDIDKWDKESFELLKKLLYYKFSSKIPFFNKLIFICTQTQKTFFDDEGFITYNIEKMEYEEFLYLISYTPLIKLSHQGQKQVYDLADGNYGLVKDIIDFSLEVQGKDVDSSLFNQSRFELVFKSIIRKRLDLLDDPNLCAMLEDATVIGKIFDSNLLMYLLNSKEYQIKQLLFLAKNQHFIYEINDKWKFSAEYIYDYFLKCVSLREPEVHYNMAQIYEKYIPSDLYSRYNHLKYAGLEREAVDALTVYCIRKIINNRYYKKEYEQIITTFPENYDVLISIKAIDFTSENKVEYSKAKNILVASEDYLNEIVLNEKLYVYALVLYRCDNIDDTNESKCILQELICQEQQDIYQWSKAALLLIVIYTNRLRMYDEAKKLERTLIFKLSSYEKLDSNLRLISSTIQRISSALYNYDISLLKLGKCYNYFQSQKDSYPKDYIMAATNYIGVCICTSNYELAIKIGETTYEFLTTHFTVNFPKIFKFFNNIILAKYFYNKLSYKECIEEFNHLFSMIPSSKNQRLLKNNYAVLLSYGDINTAHSILNSLYMENETSEHNDYYTYLFTTNLMVINIIQGNYSNAESLFNKLQNMIPTICRNCKAYITKRYSAYKQLIINQEKYNDIFSLQAEYTRIVDLIDDYWNNIFIISDCQFWTET